MLIENTWARLGAGCSGNSHCQGAYDCWLKCMCTYFVFFSDKIETLSSLNNPHFLPPHSLWPPLFDILVSELDHFTGIMWFGSCRIDLSVTGSFPWAECPLGSFMLFNWLRQGWLILHCTYVSHFLHHSIARQMFKMLLLPPGMWLWGWKHLFKALFHFFRLHVQKWAHWVAG